jgi:hypothetical protein
LKKKLNWYRANGVKPHEEGSGKAGTLIITSDTSEGGLDSGSLKKLIRDVFSV